MGLSGLVSYYYRKHNVIKTAIEDTKRYAFAHIIVKILGVISIPILARSISIKEFGIYDTFIITSTFLAVLSGSGLDSGIAVKIAETKHSYFSLRRIFSLLILSNTTSIVFLSLVAYFVFFWGMNFSDIKLFSCIVVYAFIYQYVHNIYNFLRWIGKTKSAVFVIVSTNVLGFLCGTSALLLFVDKSVYDFIYGLIFGYLLGLLLNSKFIFRFLYFKGILLNNEFNKDILKLSIPYFSASLSPYLINLTTRALVGLFFGLNEVGIYGFCNRIAQIPNLIINIIVKGVTPSMYSNYLSEYGKYFLKNILKLYLYISLLIIIISVFASEFLVSLFGGVKYMKSITLLPLIVISVIISGITQITGIGFSVKRRMYLQLIITISTLILIISFTVILKKYFSVNSIAFSVVLSTLITSYLSINISEKLYLIGYNMKIVKLFLILYFTLSVILIFL